MAINKVAGLYEIPVSTLHRHIVEVSTSRVGAGRPTVLTQEKNEETVHAGQVGMNKVTKRNIDIHVGPTKDWIWSYFRKGG